jgi:hypothetical protein
MTTTTVAPATERTVLLIFAGLLVAMPLASLDRSR